MGLARITIPFAVSGDQTAIPDTDTVNNFVNNTTGYTLDYERLIGTDPLAKAVERAKLNYVFNTYSTLLKMWQDQTFSTWVTPVSSSVGAYSQYAVTMYGGAPWQSIVSANTVTPGTDGTKWVPFTNTLPNWGAVAAATAFNTALPGVYTYTATPTDTNAPSGALAGTLAVWSYGSGGSQIQQQHYYDVAGNSWYRGYSSSTWTAWQQSASTALYVKKAGDTMSGTLINQAGVDITGGDTNGGWLRLVGASYGAMFNISSTQALFQQTASGSPSGAANTLVPIAWTLATGQVQLDKTGAGVQVGSTSISGTEALSILNSARSVQFQLTNASILGLFDNTSSAYRWYTDTNGNFYPSGAIDHLGGYGGVDSNANRLVIGGGGTSSNAGSISWGDGTGKLLNLGYNNGGTFTIRASWFDNGKLIINTSGTPTDDGTGASIQTTQPISVGTATQNQHAVRLDQLSSISSSAISSVMYQLGLVM